MDRIWWFNYPSFMELLAEDIDSRLCWLFASTMTWTMLFNVHGVTEELCGTDVWQLLLKLFWLFINDFSYRLKVFAFLAIFGDDDKNAVDEGLLLINEFEMFVTVVDEILLFWSIIKKSKLKILKFLIFARNLFFLNFFSIKT